MTLVSGATQFENHFVVGQGENTSVFDGDGLEDTRVRIDGYDAGVVDDQIGEVLGWREVVHRLFPSITSAAKSMRDDGLSVMVVYFAQTRRNIKYESA